MNRQTLTADNRYIATVLKIGVASRRFVFMKDDQYLCVARNSTPAASRGLFWGHDVLTAITGKNPRKAADFAIKTSVESGQDPIGFLSGATLCAYGANAGPARPLDTKWVARRVQKLLLKRYE